MIKLVIFDWDDVFTKGSTEGYLRCYHEAIDSLGVQLGRAEERKRILENWGKSARVELSGLLREQPELLDEAVKRYEKILMENSFVDCLSIVDGAVNLLTKLKETYILCIATGVNPKLLREKIMPKFNIPNAFSQIISVYDLDDAKGKPHPYMLEKILTTQKIEANEAVFVGDAKNDVLMARNANLVPIVVLTGHLSREEAEGLNVKHIIPDVTHIEEVLNSID